MTLQTSMLFYHIWSLIKLIVGIAILLLMYLYVDPYQDPAVAFGFGLVWAFTSAWGLTFYIIRWLQSLISTRHSKDIATESYKLSLLRWFFVLINLSMLLLWVRNKLLGWLMLVGFVVLQVALATSPTPETHEW